jgi:hypothetical protein
MGERYYYDPDSGNLFAVVDGGIWGLFASERTFGPWTFFSSDSPEYDAFHQKIFRQHKTEAVTPAELDPAPPPLPLPLAVPVDGPGRGEDTDAPCGPYPRLSRWARERGERGVTVYVVLSEDLYESACGDGRYLELETVTLSQQEAESIASRHRGQYTGASVESFTLQHEGGRLRSDDYRSFRFGRHRLRDLLTRLERRLGGRR